MKNLRDRALSDLERLRYGEELLDSGTLEFTHEVKRAKFVAEVMAIMQEIRGGEASEGLCDKAEQEVTEEEEEEDEASEVKPEDVEEEASVKEATDQTEVEQQRQLLETQKYVITQLQLDNRALEEQLVNTKTQLKEARGNKQENAPITPCAGSMSDDRHIPSLKTMLHLCEKRLEEANELADRRLDLHVTDLKNEHQREIRALKARHQFQMNSIDNWEEKQDAYESASTSRWSSRVKTHGLRSSWRCSKLKLEYKTFKGG